MPWPPDQARAIVLNLKRRGKWPPSAKVRHELSESLKGQPAPKSRLHRAVKHRGKKSARQPV